MNCPNCFTEVTEAESFCHKCGTPLLDITEVNDAAKGEASVDKKSPVIPRLIIAVVLFAFACFCAYNGYTEWRKATAAKAKFTALNEHKPEADAFESNKLNTYNDIFHLLQSINTAASSVDIDTVENAAVPLEELLPKESALKADLQHLGELSGKDYSDICQNSGANTREADIKEWITVKSQYLKDHPFPIHEGNDSEDGARTESGALVAEIDALNSIEAEMQYEIDMIPYREVDKPYMIDTQNTYKDLLDTRFDKDLEEQIMIAKKETSSQFTRVNTYVVLTALFFVLFAVLLVIAVIGKNRSKKNDQP